MIGTILLYFAVWLLKIPLYLLLALNWVIPEQVISVLAWAGQYTVYLSGDLPMYPDPEMTGPAQSIGMVQIFVAGFSFLAAFYTFKLVRFAIRMIRGTDR